jgi:hypothetical protein
MACERIELEFNFILVYLFCNFISKRANQSLKLTREARHENSFSVESDMRLVVHLKCNPRAA